MSDHPELEQLSTYVDGELDVSSRAGLEAHLPSCEECRRTLAAIRATLADVSSLGDAIMDDQSIATLDARIARERAARRMSAKRLGWVSGAAAALVAVLVISLAVLRQTPVDEAKTVAGQDLSGGAGAGALHQAESVSTDYTEESASAALQALAFGAAEAAPGAFSAPAARGVPVQAASPNLDTADTRLSAEKLAGCAADLESKGDLEPVRYEIARFKGQPAFVLFYRRPKDRPTHAEVWVMRPSDCFTLYFASARL